MHRCWFKNISESFSKEGELMKMNFPYINFKKCKKKCWGYDIGCRDYEPVELEPIYEELLEDSSLDTEPAIIRRNLEMMEL